ncbi:hypothetical protein ACFQ1E_09200 [Sphingomonas canadensis]|uniref:Uncharacterized protein n=1 Tax=Sphingomonas canadensis TaxID=1219257 RepID=A0ABW3H4U0_9SPHN|nr:hypothetical protein [Sphingomonas canadensis]MCW3836216.1 hypothetical protein [Sphingomonas canadensis]
MTILLRHAALPFLALAAAPACAAPLACDFKGYGAKPGLTAGESGGDLLLQWDGDAGELLRLRIGVDAGTPIVRDLSIRGGGDWVTVLRGAIPDFSVDTGLRRISNQQLQPLRGLGVPLNKDTVDRYRWDPFWDAPLYLGPPTATGRFAKNPPPLEGIPAAGQPGLPRAPSEIERATAAYAISGCTVRSDGGRILVTLPGVTLGAFTGALQYTVFRGTNLIRQELVASTRREWVAYKFGAGLRGMVREGARVRWRDTSGLWQQELLAGPDHSDPVPIAGANRIVTAETGGASLSLFPEPHRFFWAREVAVNMAYGWFRRDAGGSFAMGVRQNESETPEEDPSNWALYSARPGTEQRMPVYLYPRLGDAQRGVAGALAFTNGDTYRPLPGYQVMGHHYHMDLGERLIAAGSLDRRLPDLVALKGLGLNIVSQVDSITWDKPAADSLAIRQASIEGARRHSDPGFRILASQELFNSPLGGHTDLLFGNPVYWDQGGPRDTAPDGGKVHHIDSLEALMAMIRAEGVMLSMPHPRTKGSTGFPDAIRDRDYFADPVFDSVGIRWGMGLDGSETRLCEYRCWPLLDDMSNWFADSAGPLKRILAISEVRHMQPGDDIYASQPVSYLKLAALPPIGDDRPILDALRRGDSFWTTGEVLVPQWQVAGGTVVAEVHWTFPLDFVEVVWGDGKTVGRKTVSATDLPANSSTRFAVPFDARRAKWVRFAAWDNAGNGAVTQPVRVVPAR